ncbi:hypothetical protein [Bacillus pumilus]|uniref:hypothetical protein n=1 Tax=Bacillus pumilus TaxID=1408 RepID=UPI003CD0CD93
MDHQIDRFGFKTEAVALYFNYLTTPICKGLSDRGIFGVIAHRRFNSTSEMKFGRCLVRALFFKERLIQEDFS